MPGMTGKGQSCLLKGTMIAQSFVGKDENSVNGCFFCFPDLRVKVPGTYSSRFCLVILDLLGMKPGCLTPVRSMARRDDWRRLR
jgi:hypothetical protein